VKRSFANRAVFNLAAAGASALLALAILLRLTVRDRFFGPSILFYATPWPVLASGAAGLALFFAWQKRRRSAAALAFATVATLAMWLHSSWRGNQPLAPRGELRVILWNVSRPGHTLPAIADWLRAQDADVIALAEGHSRRRSTLARWQAGLPGYEALELQGEMTCLIRGRILSREERVLAANSYYALIRAEIRGRPLTILQADLNANPFRPRAHAFARLAALAQEHAAENLILLGDFNTPRESVLIEPLRGEMEHAFERAGSGLAETWPMPLPVLSLDQIWAGRGLRAMHCEHGWSFRSDHRAVVADFTFIPR
jgi:vancomycin resistance protein VanJ